MNKEQEFDPFHLDGDIDATDPFNLDGDIDAATDPFADVTGSAADSFPEPDPTIVATASPEPPVADGPTLRIRSDGSGLKITIVDPTISVELLKEVAKAAETSVKKLILDPYLAAVARPVLAFAAELRVIDAERDRRLEALRPLLPGSNHQD